VKRARDAATLQPWQLPEAVIFKKLAGDDDLWFKDAVSIGPPEVNQIPRIPRRPLKGTDFPAFNRTSKILQRETMATAQQTAAAKRLSDVATVSVNAFLGLYQKTQHKSEKIRKSGFAGRIGRAMNKMAVQKNRARLEKIQEHEQLGANESSTPAMVSDMPPAPAIQFAPSSPAANKKE